MTQVLQVLVLQSLRAVHVPRARKSAVVTSTTPDIALHFVAIKMKKPAMVRMEMLKVV